MADPKDRPGYSFKPGPPPEASRYLRNKSLRPSFDYRDVEPEEHAVAFTVAKAGQADVLTSIRSAVQKAIDEGQTLAQFKKDLTPQLQEMGWWGKQEVVDPLTGETRLVQLGSPRRLRTIYRSNLRSARAAGQWDRIQRTKDALPYLTYNLGPSERHREAHVARAGTTLPVEHPFWETWYPPNGWGCKCWLRQITVEEANSIGVSEDPKVITYDAINPRTGEVRTRVEGIDQGWERNPGAVRLERMEQLLDEKLSRAPQAVAQATVRDMASSWRVQRMLGGQTEGKVSVGLMAPEIGAAIDNPARFVKMAGAYGAKVGQKAAPVTPEIMARVSDAIARGPAAKEIGDRADLLFLVDGPDPWLVSVKNLRELGELWIQTIHRTTPEQWQRKLARSESLRE